MSRAGSSPVASAHYYPFDSASVVICSHGRTLIERYDDLVEKDSPLLMFRLSVQRHVSQHDCLCTLALWEEYFTLLRGQHADQSL